MRSQATIGAVLLTGLLAIAGLASAQPIPLPTPAPLPKDRGAPQPPRALTPPAPRASEQEAPAPQASGGISNWLPQIFGGKPDSRSADAAGFDQAQRTLAGKISAYLTSVRVLSGDFVQQGPDGRQVKGQFFIEKPGKVRFEYEESSPIEIVADGSSVIVRDRRLGTRDIYPLSQTPLRFLLSDRIDLLRDTNVVGVYADQIYATVVIDDKHPLVGTNRLMMMFDAKDFKLKQWTITDSQGYDTTVAVSNLDNKSRPDPALFVIDYTRYMQ